MNGNLDAQYAPVLETDAALIQAAPVFYRNNLDAFADRCAKWLLQEPPLAGIAREFEDGVFEQTVTFFEVIRQYGQDILKNAAVAIANSGTGLTEEQQFIVEDVLGALTRGERKIYLVKGGPGSGKSLVAVHLLMRGLSNHSQTVLALRSNRLMSVLRASFKAVHASLPPATVFSSVPRYGSGIGDEGFSGKFDLVVSDEAQRFGAQNIPVMLRRAPVCVFFYDETQILNTQEQGTRENFIQGAQQAGIPIEEHTLTAAMRSRGGAAYHAWVDQLLGDGHPASWEWRERYQVASFSDLRDMVEALREKSHAHRVALVASFTESPGNGKVGPDHIDNVRVGFPLKSGLEIYRGSGLQIAWLMDPNNDYKPFWMDGKSNQLDRAASIYGCQGFESDYIGIIWGRDFVWRDHQWQLGDPRIITDTIDSPNSMKQTAQRDPEQALRLLRNRYRIFLTRGMLGTYIFCEDGRTSAYLASVLSEP